MRLNWRILLAMIALLAMVATACASDDGDTEDTGSASTAEETDEAAEEEEPADDEEAEEAPADDEEMAEEPAGDLAGTLVGAGASSQAAAMEGWVAGFQSANEILVHRVAFVGPVHRHRRHRALPREEDMGVAGRGRVVAVDRHPSTFPQDCVSW